MSKLYDDVKKQGEQIDDLQKKVTGHDTRIETLETQAMATPTNSDVPIPNVTVSIPDNIATTENISDLVDEAIERSTEVMTNAITQLYTTVLPKQSVSEPLPAALSDEQIERIAQAAADKAVNRRYDKLDAMADTAMHRIYNLVKGALWAAIPKWAYITFGIAVLAAGGFGYGFFYQLNENSKLKDVEWLYRYERGLHTNPNVVMHRERLMLHGKPHEVDSLKSLIRHHEQRSQADTTFSYYYPSNP